MMINTMQCIYGQTMKNPNIILVYAGKKCDKIQHPFMIILSENYKRKKFS